MIRVRFAPSPTGYLHIGGARTALFNWLFAKNQNGIFILRIEDTDKSRSQPKFEEDIVFNLKTLGLEWDEFYRQSERIAFYREHLLKLIKEKKAYPCFCKKEELETEKQAMISQGVAPKYSGRCRRLDEKEAQKNINAGQPFVVRLKMPPTGKVIFKDAIRGQIKFDTELIGDFIIAKKLDEPLYNFSAVVDDILMKISHVIRAEEHISNTPKQVMIFQAFRADLPIFAHLPLILNPDRSKMSKRFNDVAARDFLNKGYLKEAILNFIALLGWHPQNDREVLTIEELIEEFDLKRVQKAGAVFNLEKLKWLNRKYISQLDMTELLKRCQSFLPQKWQSQFNSKILEIVRDRLVKLEDIKELTAFFFDLPDYPKELLFWQGRGEQTLDNLEKLYKAVEKISEDEFETPSLTEKILKIIPNDRKGDFLWPLRVSLSGLGASPGAFEIMPALEKKESLRRIQKAIDKLKK